MAKIYCKSSYLLRRDTAANWSAKNPILREGEEGYETDTGKRKVGDGTTEWNNLKYDSGIVDQTYTPDSENAQSGKAVAEAVSDKQDSLVSGTNIKTINNQSILGSGNITIEGGSGSSITIDQTFDPDSENAQSGKAVEEAVAQFAAEILQPEVNQIKDDLSNKLPKSPTDWQEWTAEERAEARERIGIGGDWEYIDEITLSEEAGLDITLNRDYKKIYMFAKKPSETSFEGETRLYFHDKNNSGWAEQKGANIQSSFSDDYTQILAECCGKLSFVAKTNSDWTYGYGVNPFFAVNTNSTDCVINHICTFACTLPAGFSIKIWGVPA